MKFHRFRTYLGGTGSVFQGYSGAGVASTVILVIVLGEFFSSTWVRKGVYWAG